MTDLNNLLLRSRHVLPTMTAQVTFKIHLDVHLPTDLDIFAISRISADHGPRFLPMTPPPAGENDCPHGSVVPVLHSLRPRWRCHRRTGTMVRRNSADGEDVQAVGTVDVQMYLNVTWRSSLVDVRCGGRTMFSRVIA